jgi:hypothetical protein
MMAVNDFLNNKLFNDLPNPKMLQYKLYDDKYIISLSLFE